MRDACVQEQERRGVVYLSRIPPYMKPMKVLHRSLFACACIWSLELLQREHSSD
jgi:hypothetical protein